MVRRIANLAGDVHYGAIEVDVVDKDAILLPRYCRSRVSVDAGALQHGHLLVRLDRR